jgi:hypothetical protein
VSASHIFAYMSLGCHMQQFLLELLINHNILQVIKLLYLPTIFGTDSLVFLRLKCAKNIPNIIQIHPRNFIPYKMRVLGKQGCEK